MPTSSPPCWPSFSRSGKLRCHKQISATGTRTRVARVRAEYPNQLDYSGVRCCRSSGRIRASARAPDLFATTAALRGAVRRKVCNNMLLPGRPAPGTRTQSCNNMLSPGCPALGTKTQGCNNMLLPGCPALSTRTHGWNNMLFPGCPARPVRPGMRRCPPQRIGRRKNDTCGVRTHASEDSGT